MSVAPTPVGGPQGAQASACRRRVPRQQAEAGAARSAFTLIELLVVISLFMILMGLTISSVVRGPKLQRMVAAEQLISDVIRQARHTARTSGQPVVLKLNKDERSISGLVRTILWQGNEGWPGPILGRTGQAMLIPDAYGGTGASTPSVVSVAAAAGPKPGDVPNTADGWTLSRQSRLHRGQAGVPDGLWVSVWVKPPIAGQALERVPPQADLPARTMLPVLLVGPAAGQPGFGTQAASSLGLALFRVDPSPVASGEMTDMPDLRNGPAVPCWEIVGWVRDAASQPIEVSSVFQGHRPADLQAAAIETVDALRLPGQVAPPFGPAIAATPVNATDIASPFIGGHWTEIGLLLADGRLTLYRDGRRIGSVAATVTGLPQHPGDDEQVVLGWMGDAPRDPDGNAGPAGSGDAVAADDASIDDVRIARLGTAMPGYLPSGVRFARSYSIVCFPDGRVEVNAAAADAAADAADIIADPDAAYALHLESDSGEGAKLRVSIAGAVTASQTRAAP